MCYTHSASTSLYLSLRWRSWTDELLFYWVFFLPSQVRVVPKSVVTIVSHILRILSRWSVAHSLAKSGICVAESIMINIENQKSWKLTNCFFVSSFFRDCSNSAQLLSESTRGNEFEDVIEFCSTKFWFSLIWSTTPLISSRRRRISLWNLSEDCVDVLVEADFEKQLGVPALSLLGDGVDTAEEACFMERLGVSFKALLKDGVDGVERADGLDVEIFKSISSSKLFGGDMSWYISSDCYMQ